MARSSASVSCSTGVVFQLLANLLSFFTIAGITGVEKGAWLEGLKLAFAAVDAIDCAMDGTVSCARREDGRPDLVGTELTTAGAGAGLTGLGEMAFTGAVVLVSAATAGVSAWVALEGFFKTAASATGFLAAAATVFLGGVATGFWGAEAAVASAGFAFTLGLVGAAAFFAGAAVAAALAGAALDLAGAAIFASGWTVLAEAVPTFALLGLALLAFTSCLLTETRSAGCGVSGSPARDAGSSGAPSARECTGLPMGSPIICNSATNIQCPVKRRMAWRLCCCGAAMLLLSPEIKPEPAPFLAAGCLWEGRFR